MRALIKLVAVAEAVRLQVTPSRHTKVVLAGNIGKFSLVLRQPGKGLSLQTKRMTDDDLGAAFAAGGTTTKDRSILCEPGKRNTKVTIYSGTDCRLYDVVREGELLGRRRGILRGIAVDCGEGE